LAPHLAVHAVLALLHDHRLSASMPHHFVGRRDRLLQMPGTGRDLRALPLAFATRPDRFVDPLLGAS
jgi:hypothetical protein